MSLAGCLDGTGDGPACAVRSVRSGRVDIGRRSFGRPIRVWAGTIRRTIPVFLVLSCFAFRLLSPARRAPLPAPPEFGHCHRRLILRSAFLSPATRAIYCGELGAAEGGAAEGVRPGCWPGGPAPGLVRGDFCNRHVAARAARRIVSAPPVLPKLSYQLGRPGRCGHCAPRRVSRRSCRPGQAAVAGRLMVEVGASLGTQFLLAFRG